MGVKFIKIILVVLIFVVLNQSQVFSQYSFLLQDSTWVYRIANGDTIPVEKITAGYSMMMFYDSTGVKYEFSELKNNSVKIKLTNWTKYSKTDSLNDSQISDLNKSECFKIVTGDTISCFRNFAYFNKSNVSMETNNYFSRDTLIYVIELLKKSNNERLAIIDSFSVLRRITSGAPSFLGLQDPWKKCKYIIPSNLNGDSVYVKVNIKTKGDGENYPRRMTTIFVSNSNIAESDDFIFYRTTFGASNYKLNSEGSIYKNKKYEGKYIVSPNPSKSKISVKSLLDSKNQLFVIYDEIGNKLSDQPITNIQQNEIKEIEISKNGYYIIVFYSNGIEVARNKILITK